MPAIASHCSGVVSCGFELGGLGSLTVFQGSELSKVQGLVQPSTLSHMQPRPGDIGLLCHAYRNPTGLCYVPC